MPREAQRKPNVQAEIKAQDTFNYTAPDMKKAQGDVGKHATNPKFYILSNFNVPQQQLQLVSDARGEASLSRSAAELGRAMGVVGNAVDEFVAYKNYKDKKDEADAEIAAAAGDYGVAGKSKAYIRTIEQIQGQHELISFEEQINKLTATHGSLAPEELGLLYNQEFTARSEGRTKWFMAGFAPGAQKIMLKARMSQLDVEAKRLKEDTLNKIDAMMAHDFQAMYASGQWDSQKARDSISAAMQQGGTMYSKDEIAQRAIETLGNMAMYHNDEKLLDALDIPFEGVAISNTKHGQRVSEIRYRIREHGLRRAEAAARRSEAAANRAVTETLLGMVAKQFSDTTSDADKAKAEADIAGSYSVMRNAYDTADWAEDRSRVTVTYPDGKRITMTPSQFNKTRRSIDEGYKNAVENQYAVRDNYELFTQLKASVIEKTFDPVAYNASERYQLSQSQAASLDKFLSDMAVGDLRKQIESSAASRAKVVSSAFAKTLDTSKYPDKLVELTAIEEAFKQRAKALDVEDEAGYAALQKEALEQAKQFDPFVKKTGTESWLDIGKSLQTTPPTQQEAVPQKPQYEDGIDSLAKALMEE